MYFRPHYITKSLLASGCLLLGSVLVVQEEPAQGEEGNA